MANLRGGTFEKQLKDAFFRLEKIGQSRHNNTVQGFVSLNRLKQAKMMLNKFSNYLQQNSINSGKLNNYLSDKETVRDFIEKEIFKQDYNPSTIHEYTSLFSKVVENLANNNVSISKETINYAKELHQEAKETFKSDNYETGRYIDNLQDKLYNLYNNNFVGGVIGEVQATMGLRISEAYEVVRNFDNYYNAENNTIEGLIGKANHEYMPKTIGYDLVQKIEAIHNNNAPIPSPSSYREDLKEAGIPKSHDLRITYAKDLYNSLKEQGHAYKDILKEVSKELNHNRLEITRYYLNRA